MKRNWKNARFEEAVEFMFSKRELEQKCSRSWENPENREGSLLEFSDGSAVICVSDWSGPISKLTPDIDSNEPLWWISLPGEP